MKYGRFPVGTGRLMNMVSWQDKAMRKKFLQEKRLTPEKGYQRPEAGGNKGMVGKVPVDKDKG